MEKCLAAALDALPRWIEFQILATEQPAATRIEQLLSHSAGLVRDGAYSGQWIDRCPFLDEAALRADLAS